jgi:hypothetical protein
MASARSLGGEGISWSCADDHDPFGVYSAPVNILKPLSARTFDRKGA